MPSSTSHLHLTRIRPVNTHRVWHRFWYLGGAAGEGFSGVLGGFAVVREEVLEPFGRMRADAEKRYDMRVRFLDGKQATASNVRAGTTVSLRYPVGDSN